MRVSNSLRICSRMASGSPPRKKKKRSNKYDLLTKPRAAARADLLSGRDREERREEGEEGSAEEGGDLSEGSAGGVEVAAVSSESVT